MSHLSFISEQLQPIFTTKVLDSETRTPVANFVLFVVNPTSTLLTTKDTKTTKILGYWINITFVTFVLFVVNLSHQNSSI